MTTSRRLGPAENGAGMQKTAIILWNNMCPLAFIWNKKRERDAWQPGSVQYVFVCILLYLQTSEVDRCLVTPASCCAFSILFLHTPTLGSPEERTRLFFSCCGRAVEMLELGVQPPHVPLTFRRSWFSLKWSQKPVSLSAEC